MLIRSEVGMSQPIAPKVLSAVLGAASKWPLELLGASLLILASMLNQGFAVLAVMWLIGLCLIWLPLRIKRSNESKLRSVFSAVPAAIVVSDEAGIIVQCNAAVAQFCGYEAHELIGKNVGVLMDSHHGAAHDAHLDRYLKSGHRRLSNEPRTLSGQGRRRDGEVFPVRLSVSETRINGKYFFIAVLQDHTVVQQAQNMLIEARDRAEQANRLRGEFLANMSHEIRTPMNGIVGMTELAMVTADELTRKEYLSLAWDSANHLLHIINDILDFSKIEAQSLELQARMVSPAQLVRHTARSLEHLAHVKGLALRVEIDDALSGMAMLDAVRMRQVLTNLIGNAIKFTKEGHVTVQANLCDTQEGVKELRIRISDTGIGFDPARTEALFSPFTQADGSITRSFGGTGLGLAITRSLLHLMGGSVEAQSAPGKGACFIAHIPLQMVDNPFDGLAQTGAADSKAAANISKHQNLMILLVEDHPINSKLAEALLDRMGHRHVSVTDGQEALDCLAQQTFDAVLMDVMMPNMDGVTALGLLRQREKESGHRTPVLMVTAHAMSGDRERFLAAGADGYVSKPLSPDELRREIDRVVSQVH